MNSICGYIISQQKKPTNFLLFSCIYCLRSRYPIFQLILVSNFVIMTLAVADLGFSKGGFWFSKNFSLKLVEDQKKSLQPFQKC